jgi:fatty-acyl-CoA synthase
MAGRAAAGRVSGAPATTLPAFLAEVAARFGSREALISSRGRLRFDELADLASRAGRALAARGVGRGTRVGILLPNWPEWIALAFGVWECGGVVVPLNTLSRPRELGYALRSADVRLLIAVRGFLRNDYAGGLEEVAPGAGTTAAPIFHRELPALREVVWLERPAEGRPVDLGPLLASESTLGADWPQCLADRVRPADPATVVFTSGTTAEPKGVVHVHRALCRAATDVAAVLGIEADDRTWGYLPFFFIGGLVAVAMATMSRGAAVVLQDVFEAGETLRLLRAERVTVFFAWPHQAEALIAHPSFGASPLFLRKGVGANTKWAATLYPADHLAVGTFGMTETAPLCTAWPWDAPLALRAGSHGPPVAGKEVRIVDPETGASLPSGREGEICVRGPTLFSHYDGQEPAACVDAEGFFHTGDLGRLDERGALHFLGRIKDVIKSAGVNIAAAEVEAVLLTHPAVGAAHVVGVPDAARGENVAAFVVLSRPVSTDELLAHCRTHLASYKVPRHIWVRAADALPLKATGKVDKPRLRDEATRLVTTATGDAARS